MRFREKVPYCSRMPCDWRGDILATSIRKHSGLEMSNIFMLPGSLTGEDRFTSSLHYIIDSNPEIGQQLGNALLQAAHRNGSKFVRAVDHPLVDDANRPDFLLEFEDFDIFCEHKLQSLLGYLQLERYLETSWHREAFVALISLGKCSVSSLVREHRRYISPTSAPHYNWCDLYSVLSTGSDRLSRDFVAYMNSLGMKPLDLPNGWGNIFTSRPTAEAFGMQFEMTRDYFSAKGAMCKIDGSRLGFQIRNVKPWLRLFYLCVKEASQVRQKRFDENVLVGRVYVDASVSLNQFSSDWTMSLADDAMIVGIPVRSVASWDKSLSLVYEFQTPLSTVISNDASTIQERLLRFAKAAFNHAVDENEKSLPLQSNTDSLS